MIATGCSMGHLCHVVVHCEVKISQFSTRFKRIIRTRAVLVVSLDRDLRARVRHRCL